MITLHITGHNLDLDAKMKLYVEEKIGSLDKYLPRGAKNFSGKVVLSYDASGREDNCYICEAQLEVPGPNLLAKEATLNIYAAIDIVALKLKSQAKTYKDKHSYRRRQAMQLFNRVLRRTTPAPAEDA